MQKQVVPRSETPLRLVGNQFCVSSGKDLRAMGDVYYVPLSIRNGEQDARALEKSREALPAIFELPQTSI